MVPKSEKSDFTARHAVARAARAFHPVFCDAQVGRPRYGRLERQWKCPESYSSSGEEHVRNKGLDSAAARNV